MNSKNSALNPKLDMPKWIGIGIILMASIYANYHFDQVVWSLRAAIGILILAVLTGLAFTTVSGQNAWLFIKSARTELRKVVWPTRQETIQTTIVVMVMVAIAAMILWGVDAFFLWAISGFTGSRG